MKKKWILFVSILIILGVIIFLPELSSINEKFCKEDSDCVFVNKGCCYGCGYGEPVNKQAKSIIEFSKKIRCMGSICPMVDCGYLAAIKPLQVCEDNLCHSKNTLDCGLFCSFKDSPDFVNKTAYLLNRAIADITNSCNCKR
jgi:hypothetical protein